MDLQSNWGGDGPASLAFLEGLRTAYSYQEKAVIPNDWVNSQLIRLKTHFVAVVDLALLLPNTADVERLFTLIQPTTDSALKIICSLDADYVSKISGVAAADAFRSAQELKPEGFATSTSAALTAALKAGKRARENDGARGHDESRGKKCDKWGKLVTGRFKDHNPS